MDVTQAQLARLVRQALANLYDLAFLRKHPLARQFADSEPGARPAQAGEVLRQRLLAAIQRLAPDAQVKPDAKAWRPYRVLQMRYIEACDVAQVQQELALSKSQYYREHELGLESLVALLWEEREGSGGDLWDTAAVQVAEAAPLAEAGEPRRHNLPLQLTSFIGRTAELAEAMRLLRGTRLLTLMGAGGVGKTRLALEVATKLQDDFKDGVYFISLAPIRHPDLIATAIAQAVDLREEGSRPLLEALTDFLAAKHVLLVLDNFEQLVAGASLIAAFLEACPHLTVLVTSRAVLHLVGERTYAVPPLALPDRQHVSTAEVLSQSEAVRLFIDRAQAVKADFHLSDDNAAAVAEICVRLDGLPLAIELAAARVRLLSAKELLARLTDRFALLTGGARNLPERQQTLRSCIGWSYELLDEAERDLLRSLSVFAGSWTLAAADAVCNPDGERDILDGMASLVDTSLVGAVEQRDGDLRFSMLETIHEFAWEQLVASGEAVALRQRHAAWFLGLAETAELIGPKQVQWYARLAVEHDNLRAALQWSTEGSDPETLTRLGAALWRLWSTRGHWAEGRRWLGQVLARGAFPDSGVLVGVLMGAGILARAQRDYTSARVLFARVAALAKEQDNERWKSDAYCQLGFVAMAEGDLDRAEHLLEIALGIRRQGGRKWLIGVALSGLGQIALQRGNDARATELLTEATALYREDGASVELASANLTLGDLVLRHGEVDRATACYDESLRLSRKVGGKRGVVAALLQLAGTARLQAEPRLAVARFTEAFMIALAHDDPSLLDLWLRQLVAGVVSAVKSESACRMFAAIEAALTAHGEPGRPPEYEQAVTAMRASLGEQLFEEAWSAGLELPLETAIAEALARPSLDELSRRSPA